jgi:polysaccharide deacetylase 2 family uncharacterized protein YibQ
MTDDPTSQPGLKASPTPLRAWARLWGGLGTVALLALLAAVLTKQHLDARPLDLDTYTTALADTVEDTLVQGYVPREFIQREPALPRNDQILTWHLHPFQVEVPEPLTTRGIERLLRKSLAQHYASVAAETGEPGERRLALSVAGRVFAEVTLSGEDTLDTLDFDPPPAPPPSRPLQLASLPLESSTMDLRLKRLGGKGRPGTPITPRRAAIIIDDGGYGGPVTEIILGLDPRLTLSILPYTPYARETAERAAVMGFEVMLHMPMESDNARARFPGAVMTTMPTREIVDLTETALAFVPGAAGVNNHTGSKFTSDAEHLGPFLQLLKDRSLYFVDSYTSSESKVAEIGAALGLPVGRRDLFLDNDQGREQILEAFDQFIDICIEQGQAVGICHFRPITATVLAEVLPKLQENGIALVHASELIR